MIIKSNIHDYNVEILPTLDIKQFINDKNVFFVIDRNVYEIYNEIFISISSDNLFILQATEENKTIECALQICDKMIHLSAKRNAVLFSIGGGITQDVTGFVANVMYRGIRWIFVPTTLLSACDSCIGGKTSLNYKKYKNLFGTFYPPTNIYIVPSMFATLREQDYCSGLGEVVKFNIMGGCDLNKFSEDVDRLLCREDGVINDYLLKSLNFKKTFIEQDEFDGGKRILLNFAHTFGHAIETSSHYEIPHGTAVAIGMLVADRISYKRGILSQKTVTEIEKIIKRIVKIDVNLIDNTMVISAIKNDKKQVSNSIRAILMNDRRELLICDDLQQKEILAAFDEVKSIFNREFR